MKKLLEFLNGKKTYILAAAVAIIGFMQAVGWIDDDTAKALYAIFGGGTAMSLRHGISKVKK